MLRLSSLALLLPLTLSLSACGTEKTPATPTEKPAEGKEPPNTAATPAKAPTLTPEDLKKSAQNIALVPSPAEMQRALEKAGISGGLSKLVPDRKLKLDIANLDIVAVRTGVILADTLLTVKDAPNDVLIARMNMVKEGMLALKSGDDIKLTIEDIVARIQNNGVSRDDLVKELDELHGAVIPEIKYEAGEQIVPLLQAGSWLAGSNLVASAIISNNKPEAGGDLLRQPAVVDYFMKYVKVEGTSRAPADVLKQLEAALTTLGELSRQRALTLDDVKKVKEVTDNVLGLL